MIRRRLVVANWKMYKTVAQSVAYAREVCRRLEQEPVPPAVEMVVAPTYPALAPVAARLQAVGVAAAAQNLDPGREGALTGAVSAYLLWEAGARYVIVGHSERRQMFQETDLMVAEKVGAALSARLTPILCVGESHVERERGETESVIGRQLAAVFGDLPAPAPELVVAYEPIWAIGTGVVAEPGETNRVAALIRSLAEKAWPGAGQSVRVLYGGSVNPRNVRDIFGQGDIDGTLIGSASLRVDDFLAMARAGAETGD
ncbi:MAG: triose-phosphate isomerase [Clostridia bacterium]